MKKLWALFLSILFGLTVGFAIPAISNDNQEAAVVIASEEDTELMVCVDWETKELRFSRYWQECPPRHTEKVIGIQGPKGEPGLQGERGPRGFSGSGSRGPAGETTSLWDSLDGCHKKLNAALEAGYEMHLKSDRDEFEGATGCIVENILDEDFIEAMKRIGLPVITDIQFESTLIRGGGSGTSFGELSLQSLEARNVQYRVQIANYDAYSDSGNGERYEYCLASEDADGETATSYRPEEVVEVGGGEFLLSPMLTGTLYESDTFRAQFNLGYVTGGKCKPLYNWTVPRLDPIEIPIFVNEDPARYLNSDVFQDQLSAWGWK